jgi:hypothetical protein
MLAENIPTALSEVVIPKEVPRSVWMISCSRPPLLTHARRGRLQEKVRFARDSPLEGDGFRTLGPPSRMSANTEIAADGEQRAQIGGKMAISRFDAVA